MAGRFIFASEAAPTVFSAVICFSSLVGLPDSLVRKDKREVCPLSRGVMSPKAHLLSITLRNGIRFFPRPLPAPPSTRLASYLPIGSDTGSGKEATLPLPPPLRTVRATFTAYRSSTDKPASDPAGRELSFSTFTFLLTLSVITCCQLMQGRDSEIKPTSSFQRIPVYYTLQ